MMYIISSPAVFVRDLSESDDTLRQEAEKNARQEF
jgi:hypothetical protein